MKVLQKPERLPRSGGWREDRPPRTSVFFSRFGCDELQARRHTRRSSTLTKLHRNQTRQVECRLPVSPPVVFKLGHEWPHKNTHKLKGMHILGGKKKDLEEGRGGKKRIDLGRDRTCNLLIRSQTPCHWATRPCCLEYLIPGALMSVECATHLATGTRRTSLPDATKLTGGGNTRICPGSFVE